MMNKMRCLYCRPPYMSFFDESIGETATADEVRLIIDCDGQNLRMYDNITVGMIAVGKINYCPICGRKLSE